MIKHIEKYETSDGQEFMTRDEAQEHEKVMNEPLLKLICVGLGFDDDPYCEISTPDPNAIEIRDFIIKNKKKLITILSK
jgi:hypothetical protein